MVQLIYSVSYLKLDGCTICLHFHSNKNVNKHCVYFVLFTQIAFYSKEMTMKLLWGNNNIHIRLKKVNVTNLMHQQYCNLTLHLSSTLDSQHCTSLDIIRETQIFSSLMTICLVLFSYLGYLPSLQLHSPMLCFDYIIFGLIGFW